MPAVISNVQTEYEEIVFEKLDMPEQMLEGYRFDQCKFSKCNFNEATFKQCQFIDCEFLHCNLSLIKVNQSSFLNAVFEDSKVIGVNWSYGQWPQVKLPSPIHFHRCDISLSSFFELSLAEITIEDCKAHEVDFREADLSQANLAYTDFLGSQFVRTKLISADFTEAVNYNIDIELNDIRKATFSFPEAISLLNSLEINIIGLDNA